MLLINKFINVYELDDVLSNYHDLKTNLNIVLDFDNAVHGFTLLRIYDVRKWSHKSINMNDDGTFLLNKTWKRVLNRHNNVINEPCISDKLGIMDTALCLRYTKWPSRARQWIARPHFCVWPPVPLINNIVQG